MVKKELLKTKITKPERKDETITIRLPPSILKLLNAYSKTTGVSRGAVLRYLISDALEARVTKWQKQK